MRINRGGFTVVEVSIFIAAAGMMFLGSISLFTRYQRETQFSQSIKQVESEFNDLINDTVTGVYPELPDVVCSHSGGSALDFNVLAGSQTGSNNGCIFLGKAIQLGEGAYDADAPNPSYKVHTLVGRNTPEVTSFNDGITPGGSAIDHTYFQALYSTGSPSFDTTESGALQWGSGITSAFIRRSAAPGDIAYVRGLAIAYDRFGEYTAGSSFVGGSASVGLYAIVSRQGLEDDISASIRSTSDFIADLSYGMYQGEDTQFVPLGDTLDGLFVCIKNANNYASLELKSSSFGGAPTFDANFNPPAECPA